MKKIKISKEAIKSILSFDWWVFLSLPLVFGLSISYIFYLTDKPKSFEQIGVFSGFQLSEKISNQFFTSFKDEFVDYGILETKFYSINEQEITYNISFSDSTFNNYEIVIMSYNKYQENQGIINNSTISLDPSYFDSELEFLNYQDKFIGIKIYDENNTFYNDNFTFKENLNLTNTTYAFASLKSINSNRLVDDLHSLTEFSLMKFVSLFLK